MNIKLIYQSKSRILRKIQKPRSQEKKQEKEIVLENLYKLWESRENILDALKAKHF